MLHDHIMFLCNGRANAKSKDKTIQPTSPILLSPYSRPTSWAKGHCNMLLLRCTTDSLKLLTWLSGETPTPGLSSNVEQYCERRIANMHDYTQILILTLLQKNSNFVQVAKRLCSYRCQRRGLNLVADCPF